MLTLLQLSSTFGVKGKGRLMPWFKATFSGSAPYLTWLLVSIAALVGAWATEPYVFGFTAFGAAFVSLVLVVVSLFMSLRSFLLATLACIPTVAAFALLSTYSWA